MTLFDAVSENGIFAEAIKIFYRQAETRRPSTFYEDLKTPEDDSILLCSRERNGWASYSRPPARSPTRGPRHPLAWPTAQDRT